MELRLKPIFEIVDNENIRQLFILQKQKRLWKFSWWIDVNDIHGRTIYGTKEYCLSCMYHLMDNVTF